MGFADIPEENKTENNKIKLLNNKRFTGLDGKEISEMMQLSHTSTLNDVISKKKSDELYVPTLIASIPQIRMTRRIDGEYTLDTNEKHKFFKDSIGLVSDWKKRGPIYEVPFSTLYSKTIKKLQDITKVEINNTPQIYKDGIIKILIVAGRCTSFTDSMWDIMRFIPCCAVTGQAAGTAAAITNDFSKLDINLLQESLQNDGVKIHVNQL